MNISQLSAFVRPTFVRRAFVVRLLFFSLPLFFAPVFSADNAEMKAAATRDLGQGLFYFRVTNLSGQLADLRAALAKHSALVVDLRGVNAGVSTSQALRSALVPVSDKLKVARFVLINAATSSSVPFALGGGLPDNSIPGVVIIAPESGVLAADVNAPCSADEDKRACEAIANGTPLEKLIDFRPVKQRYDEAVLVREHAGEPPDESEAEPAKTDGETTDAKDAKKSAPNLPLIDYVLQAAVQTHRALAALKKL